MNSTKPGNDQSLDKENRPWKIQTWRSGAALDENPDTCTKCHAGKNPFIVHPEAPPFDDILNNQEIDLMPDNWYDPIVHPDWPKNPGPMPTLGTVEGDQRRCDGCHTRSGDAHRFPQLWYETSTGDRKRMDGYCDVVVENALKDKTQTATLIQLTRSLGEGEEVVAAQRVGECLGEMAWRTSVAAAEYGQ